MKNAIPKMIKITPATIDVILKALSKLHPVPSVYIKFNTNDKLITKMTNAATYVLIVNLRSFSWKDVRIAYGISLPFLPAILYTER